MHFVRLIKCHYNVFCQNIAVFSIIKSAVNLLLHIRRLGTMLSNVFLRIRSIPGLEKQFRCIASMYRTSPRQSSLKESKLRGFPLLPTCGCGLPNGTVSHISYTNALRADKIVGMRYEDGTLIYFGAKAPLVKGTLSNVVTNISL